MYESSQLPNIHTTQGVLIMSKLLTTYEVREDIFNKILYELSYRTEYTNNIVAYSYGYSNKNTIYYDDEYLICSESVLNYYTDAIEDCSSWKQVKLRKVKNADVAIQHTITGNYAWNYIMNILKKYYSDKEVDDILHAHEAEYSEGFKQFHYNTLLNKYELKRFKNCFKYDINGAHCDAVLFLFPLARDTFMKMYKQRREKPVYKQIFNFFVGELCRKGYRLTYNWIVQRTTKKLYEAMDTVDGQLIYANTDGFIVQDPNRKIDTSKELFDFKLEYAGDVYVYQSHNYILYQCGEDKTGSCRCEVRNDIDLRQGIVVDYKNNRVCIGTDINGNNRYNVELVDIVKRRVNIDE